MRAWAYIFITGGFIWFAADLLSTVQPGRTPEIWTAAFTFAAIAGAIAGLRGKTARKAGLWLARYAGTFLISGALLASLWSLGDITTAIAVDVASAITIASLYLTCALWTSFLRPTLAITGLLGWVAAMAGYFAARDQAALVMAFAGGALLAAPGLAILRLLPPRKRKPVASDSHV